MKKSIAILAVAGIVTLAGCQTTVPAKKATGESGVKATKELTEYAANVTFIRGHLYAAKQNIAEKLNYAEFHAKHPVDEGNFSIITNILKSEDETLAQKLESSFTSLPEETSAGNSNAIEETDELMNKALDAMVPEELQSDLNFRATIIGTVLETVRDEYGEAVSLDGKLKMVEEYQDGLGFYHQAKELYNNLADQIPAASKKTIDTQFTDLDMAFNSIKPPTKPASRAKVETAVSNIVSELEKVTGEKLAAKRAPEEIIAYIKEHLASALAKYKAGQTEEAKDTAARGYFEGYEKIEADIMDTNQTLNDKLEPMLSKELRAKMDSKAPAAEVEQLINDIDSLLQQAEMTLGN